MNITNIYTLSNNYIIRIIESDIKRSALLYNPSNELILEGIPSVTSSEDVLIQEVIIQQWPFGERPSVISLKTPFSLEDKNFKLTKLFKIEGKVINSTNDFLSGISVSITTKGSNRKIESKTDEDGFYSLNIILEILSDNTPNERPAINYSDPSGKYSDTSLIPFSKDNQLLSNPDPVKLNTKKQDLDEQISKYKQQSGTDIVKVINNKIPKPPEETLINFIKTQIKIILKTMLPAVLSLITAFGIDKISDFTEKKIDKCPKKSKLDELIKLRNKIVAQLNTISKILDTLIIAIGFTQGLLGVLKITFNILLALPIPLPPFVPSNIVQGTANVIQTLQKLIDKFSNISITVLIALMIMKSVIALILSLLKILDSLLAHCYPDNINNQLTKLSPELDILQKELNPEDQSDISSIRRLNGFTLGIEIIDKNAIGDLKRKQAIAKNSQDITILRGEPSFSANEEILLDELEFHIKSNNLKAY